nr:pyruvate dehydrogenase E1 component subunit alpha, mitochondrial [Hydra vulgaris]
MMAATLTIRSTGLSLLVKRSVGKIFPPMSFQLCKMATVSSQSAEFLCQPYKYHKLDGHEIPSSGLVTRDQAMDYYRKMAVIRRMEQEASKLYKEKFIRGFCHLYSGQEATCVGINDQLDNDDSVITAYRAHGWTYIKGRTVAQVLSELTGRKTGCTEGKGGSMHMYAHEFYGGNGIVGAQVPLGAGIALAHQYRNNGHCCVTLYGDGAANQGQVFEAFNMAALWHLPCIFVVENNGYGMGTSSSRSSFVNEYYTRGDYIPGIQVDGNCVVSVREAAKFAVHWTKSGKGPILLECNTYRYFGHSMSDPGTSYRTRDEVQEMRLKRDPIASFKEKILNSKLLNEDNFKAIDKSVKEEVDLAVESARSDPEPDVNDMALYIYSEGNNGKEVRGADLFTHWKTNDKISL